MHKEDKRALALALALAGRPAEAQPRSGAGRARGGRSEPAHLRREEGYAAARPVLVLAQEKLVLQARRAERVEGRGGAGRLARGGAGPRAFLKCSPWIPK